MRVAKRAAEAAELRVVVISAVVGRGPVVRRPSATSASTVAAVRVNLVAIRLPLGLGLVLARALGGQARRLIIVVIRRVAVAARRSSSSTSPRCRRCGCRKKRVAVEGAIPVVDVAQLRGAGGFGCVRRARGASESARPAAPSPNSGREVKLAASLLGFTFSPKGNAMSAVLLLLLLVELMIRVEFGVALVRVLSGIGLLRRSLAGASIDRSVVEPRDLLERVELWLGRGCRGVGEAVSQPGAVRRRSVARDAACGREERRVPC